MRTHLCAGSRLLLVIPLLLGSASMLWAQAADPSGHWTGAIHVPPFNGAGSREVAVDIDLARNSAGMLAGTFSQGQAINGLPLANVALDGRTVSFELKATSGGGVFRGTVDGTSIAGDFTTTEGGYTIPFNLTRTGDAAIAPAPKNAPIRKELEGTWNGTLDINGRPERLILTMTNQPDGTSTAVLRDLDGSNVDIPVAMVQNGSSVTIDVAIVGGSFSGVLNGNGELAGAWSEATINLPLLFKRAAK